jgi:hypothetical protein
MWSGKVDTPLINNWLSYLLSAHFFQYILSNSAGCSGDGTPTGFGTRDAGVFGGSAANGFGYLLNGASSAA